MQSFYLYFNAYSQLFTLYTFVAEMGTNANNVLAYFCTHSQGVADHDVALTRNRRLV